MPTIETAYEPTLYACENLTYGGMVSLVAQTDTHHAFRVTKPGRQFDIVSMRGTDQDEFLLTSAADIVRFGGVVHRWLMLVLPHMGDDPWVHRVREAYDHATYTKTQRSFHVRIKLRPDDTLALAETMINGRQLFPITPRNATSLDIVASTGHRIADHIRANFEKGVYKRRES